MSRGAPSTAHLLPHKPGPLLAGMSTSFDTSILAARRSPRPIMTTRSRATLATERHMGRAGIGLSFRAARMPGGTPAMAASCGYIALNLNLVKRNLHALVEAIREQPRAI